MHEGSQVTLSAWANVGCALHPAGGGRGECKNGAHEGPYPQIALGYIMEVLTKHEVRLIIIRYFAETGDPDI